LDNEQQVYYDNDVPYTGSAGVNFMLYYDDKESISLEAGSITGGILTLALPSSIDSQYLVDVNETISDFPGVTASSASAKLGSGYLYMDSGSESADLYYEKGTKDEWAGIEYYYCSEAVTITGSSSDNYGGYSDTYTFDIRGKQGWNEIYVIGKATDTSFTVTYTTDLSKAPSDLKWYVSLSPQESEQGGGGYAVPPAKSIRRSLGRFQQALSTDSPSRAAKSLGRTRTVKKLGRFW
jgi:hypothetical protein